MSVDFEDVEGCQRKLYQQYLEVRPIRFCQTEALLKHHLERARFAVEKERTRLNQLSDQWAEEDDNRLLSGGGRSDYKKRQRLLEFCGNPRCYRLWWYSTAEEVDKLYDLNYSERDLEVENFEEWYSKKASDFNQVHKLLSPWAKQ